MQGKKVKREEVLKALEEAFEYVKECREKGKYPQLSEFLINNKLSINFFNRHCPRWKETQELYSELKNYLADSKLYAGLHARKVKATHLIALDLMNNHGWREKKEEQQHQYIHDIDKLREKLKNEGE